jgi:glycerol-3-phosphate O-acyltransferase
VTAVTPGSVVATVLLNPHRRGVSHGELVETCGRLLKGLRRLGARISKSLLTPAGELREEAIVDAARLFMDADMIQTTVPGEGGSSAARARAKIYSGPDVFYIVPDEKRLALDLSKNIIVHFFVPRALVASALLVPTGDGTLAERGTPTRAGAVGRATVEERVRQLSRLFKYEFMFRADATFEENFTQTLSDMVASSEILVDGAGDITFGLGHDGLDGHAWARFYASIARTFLEGYRVAARGLGALLKAPLQQKDLVRRTMVTGERMFLRGEIQRREAVSSPVIENALLSFADQGYVAQNQGKLSLPESFATSAAVRTIEARIAGYCTEGRGAT